MTCETAMGVPSLGWVEVASSHSRLQVRSSFEAVEGGRPEQRAVQGRLGFSEEQR